MAGTSMATPMAAGAAALIRQYFEDPRFWASTCNVLYMSCKAFSPLASTVKAMLINSAFPALYVSGVGYLSTPPDSNQGFGHIILKGTLPLKTNTTGLDLLVQEATLKEGMSLSIFISVTWTSLPLRVTIM